MLLVHSLGGLGGLSALGGNGPLGELHPDTVGAGLDDDAVLFDGADGADDAADGGDLISDGQLTAHLGQLFFLLVLRPDQQEIEDGQHDHQHTDRRHPFQKTLPPND